jgi:hypothetical protein
MSPLFPVSVKGVLFIEGRVVLLRNDRMAAPSSVRPRCLSAGWADRA